MLDHGDHITDNFVPVPTFVGAFSIGRRVLTGSVQFSIRSVIWRKVGKMPEEASRERNTQEERAVLIPPEVQAVLDGGEIATGRIISEGKHAQTRDFVNALAISDAGEAMIFEEGATKDGGMSWHVVGGPIENGEDPMSAIQRALLESTGYSSDTWLYLGSYMLAEADHDLGVGHFFCARDARSVGQPVSETHREMKIRWVSQQDLRYALLDGRISILSYAITISMALLTVLD